jgi:hypothetical protein
MIVLSLLGWTLLGQDTVPKAPPPPDTADPRQWSVSAAVAGYLIPHSRSYVSPTVTADRASLHLEGRYNYENLQTGSIWIGYNFTLADKPALNFTPMIGGVFGKKNGIAPGYLGTVDYKGIALFSQGEFVFDTSDKTGSFFYTWSEISYAPLPWFRAGIAVQRTKAYQTEFSVQRGLLAGLSYKKLDFTAYLFDPGSKNPTGVIILGVRF